MKEPILGSNKTQSFIDFETTRGKIRLGQEELLIFTEFAGTRINLTDESGNFKKFDGIDITSGKISVTTPLLKTGFPNTVSIIEYGDGYNMIDVITLDGFIVGAIPAAAAALAVGAVVAYFPASAYHIEEVYYQDLQLQLPGTPVNADLGLGSLVGSGAQALLSSVGATAEDRLTGQTNATAAVYGSAVRALVRSALTGISVNLTNSVKDIFLNAAGTWNVNNAGNLLAKGTIIVKWTKIT